MADELIQLCRADLIDIRTTVPEIIEIINERAATLDHYKLSLAFKIQTIRTFYRRDIDDYMSASEAQSTTREISNQISTIECLRSIVADIYHYIRRLERILFFKQIGNEQHHHQQQ